MYKQGGIYHIMSRSQALKEAQKKYYDTHKESILRNQKIARQIRTEIQQQQLQAVKAFLEQTPKKGYQLIGEVLYETAPQKALQLLRQKMLRDGLTLRNESTPDARAIWAAVDSAAAKAPDWVRRRIAEAPLGKT